jgi:hypothetical protein
MRKYIFTLGLVVLFNSLVWAEDAIYLKNGKVIQGDILSETTYSVKIMSKGFPQTYYRQEIDRIEKDEDIDQQAMITPQTKEGLSSQQKELIKRLLEANGVRDVIAKNVAKVMEQAPADMQSMLRAHLSIDAIIERIIPVYAKYYTEGEIKELLTFYKSEIGRKSLETNPKIIEDTMGETLGYLHGIMTEIKK